MNVSIQPVPEYAEILISCAELDMPDRQHANVGITAAVKKANHGESRTNTRTSPRREAIMHPTKQAISLFERFTI